MLLGLVAFVARILLDPLKAISSSARRISMGTFDVSLPPESKDEIGDLSLHYASWLPGGREVILVAAPEGKSRRLYRMEVDSGTIRPLHDVIVSQSLILVSPDGTQVFFSNDRGFGTTPDTGSREPGIYVVNADGTGLRQLTDDVYRNIGPRWCW